MHYIDQFINEQNERSVLSGHKKIIPEYIDNYMYPFNSYDDEDIQYVLVQITDLIRKGSIDIAKGAFDNLSDKVKEGINPERRKKEWELLLALAMELDELEK
jgi:hypothetical protein